MQVRDLMTSRVACVAVDESVEKACATMREHDVGILPVVADRAGMKARGVITDRDVAIRHVAEGHGPGCGVRDHMTHDLLYVVHPETDAREVIARMARHRVRRLVAVDADLRVVGVVSLADVALRLGPRWPLELAFVVECLSEPQGLHAAGRTEPSPAVAVQPQLLPSSCDLVVGV